MGVKRKGHEKKGGWRMEEKGNEKKRRKATIRKENEN